MKHLKTTFYSFLCSLLISGCGGSDLPVTNGSGNNTDTGQNNTIPDASSTITQKDGSLVLTKFSESVAPPAKVSVLFNVKTESGKPVTGLSLNDFEFYENDSPISRFEAQPQIIPEESDFTYSTLLLLDFSASVVATGLDTLKEGAVEFINNVLNTENSIGGKEVAIGIFDGSATITLISNFQKDPNSLLEQINALDESYTLDNSTNLYGAIEESLGRLQRRLDDNTIVNPDLFVAGALVLFTDGRDQAARVTKQEALDAINNATSNIALYSIGLGEEIDVEILEAVGQNGFQQVDSLSNLVTTFTQIATSVAEEANSYYRLDYCSGKRGGIEHDLRVSAFFEGLTGELNVTFSAEDFTGGCTL